MFDADPAASAAPQERPRILVVDDAPENLGILLYALKEDYTVIGARTGVKALQLAAAAPAPDLILLDIVMPEMDGYQVCARLMADEKTRSIPVIFLTALDEDESETIGLGLGAVDYIRKPIHLATLRLRVKLHLELLWGRRRLEAQNSGLLRAARLREDVENIARHDLKGPLSSIIGVPEFLLMHCDFTEDQRSLLKTVEEAGYIMLEMINRSLDFFKMENGMYEFRPEPIDLITVIRQVMAELASTITAKSLSLALLIDGRPMRDGDKAVASVERFLCHSMFSNLLKNAVEASPSAQAITIDFGRGALITTSIGNAGEVPEEIRKNFFEKFVTAGKRTGTGLGTYSASLIVRTQNGTISLDTSAVGRTCVRVAFPAA